MGFFKKLVFILIFLILIQSGYAYFKGPLIWPSESSEEPSEIPTFIGLPNYCYDSDFGADYNIAGEITFSWREGSDVKSYTYPDSCMSERVMIEAFCLGNSPQVETHLCSGRQMCYNGRCIPIQYTCDQYCHDPLLIRHRACEKISSETAGGHWEISGEYPNCECNWVCEPPYEKLSVFSACDNYCLYEKARGKELKQTFRVREEGYWLVRGDTSMNGCECLYIPNPGVEKPAPLFKGTLQFRTTAGPTQSAFKQLYLGLTYTNFIAIVIAIIVVVLIVFGVFKYFIRK